MRLKKSTKKSRLYSLMPTRSRKEEKRYREYLASDEPRNGCQFCAITKDSPQFVSESKSFYVIRNIFPYSHWDGQGVLDHLLLIPKKHTNTLSDLTAPEAVEYVDIIGSYERSGYDIHARGPSSNRKSVVHQHTHFIKLDRKHNAFMFYINKPYIRFTR